MTSDFQPKRVKLEILKPNGAQSSNKIVKILPFGASNNESRGANAKVCRILSPSQVSSNLQELDEGSRDSSNDDLNTPKKLSIHRAASISRPKSGYTSILKDSNKKLLKSEDSYQLMFEKTFSSVLNKEKEPEKPDQTKSNDVIHISDESDSDATEKELDADRNLDFIEEASVGDDEFPVTDFQEFFSDNINPEHHDKIVDELLKGVQTTPHKDANASAISTNLDIPQENIDSVPISSLELPPTELNFNHFLSISGKVPDSTRKTASLMSEEHASAHTREQSTSSPSLHATRMDPSATSEVLHYLKRIEKRLTNIEKRLTKIEEAQNINRDNEMDSSDSDDLIDDDMLLSLKFPIKKKHSLEILENILKVPKMKRNLELKFKQYLGINESDTIEMILCEMLNPLVQESFKWRQTDTTRSFENFVYINKLIFDCVKHHFQLFTNVEYIRLMSLILNRPCRISAIQRSSSQSKISYNPGQHTPNVT